MNPVFERVRKQVWDNYCNGLSTSICFCCKIAKIDSTNWQIGHIVAKSLGGCNRYQNLRPLCQACNRSMATKNMFDFMFECGFINKREHAKLKNEYEKVMKELDQGPDEEVKIVKEINIEVPKIDLAKLEKKMYHASISGDLKQVKYLHEVYKVSCNEPHAIDYASENGYYEVVKYLHEIVKAPCSVSAINCASKNGYLEIVKYLYETVKAPHNKYAMVCASKNRHYEVMKYLHEIVGINY